MEYSRVRAIAYPTKGSDCNNEPYYLSFIQTTDRMGAKEKIELKQEQVFIGDSLIHQYCFKRTIILYRGIIWRIRRIPDIGGCCRKNIL